MLNCFLVRHGAQVSLSIFDESGRSETEVTVWAHAYYLRGAAQQHPHAVWRCEFEALWPGKLCWA